MKNAHGDAAEFARTTCVVGAAIVGANKNGAW